MESNIRMSKMITNVQITVKSTLKNNDGGPTTWYKDTREDNLPGAILAAVDDVMFAQGINGYHPDVTIHLSFIDCHEASEYEDKKCPECGKKESKVTMIFVNGNVSYRCFACGAEYGDKEEPETWDDFFKQPISGPGFINGDVSMRVFCPECGSNNVTQYFKDGDEEATFHCHGCGHETNEPTIKTDESLIESVNGCQCSDAGTAKCDNCLQL